MSAAPEAPIGWLPAAGESRPVVCAPHIPRLLAWLVDGVLIVLAGTVVLVGFGILIAAQGLTDPSLTGFLAGLMAATFALVLLGYQPWFWAGGGQTSGMRVFGLRVVRNPDGGRVGGRQAVVRMAGYIVSILVFCAGLAWILFDEEHRGWHDILADTVVVRR